MNRQTTAEFEVIATRPGEVVSGVLPSLEAALMQAREYALNGWTCLVIERTDEADPLEIVVMSEAA